MPHETDELLPIKKKSISGGVARYHRHDVLRDEDGNEYFSTYIFEDIPISELDDYHEIQSGEEGRLDLIAFKYYNTPLLDWIIAAANNISSPIKDVIPGVTLRIPSSSTLFKKRIIRG